MGKLNTCHNSSSSAFLFSLVLTGLEIFVIHAFCRYCIVSAVITTIMLILSISYLRTVNKVGTLSAEELSD